MIIRIIFLPMQIIAQKKAIYGLGDWQGCWKAGFFTREIELIVILQWRDPDAASGAFRRDSEWFPSHE